uniref:Uncharacterized protein n=1 Tax=Pseudoalteromonas undina TaxID=43660 RepID=A0ABP2XT87_9GAMM
MVVMSVLDIVKPVREQTCNVWLIAVVETINGQCLLFALCRSSAQCQLQTFDNEIHEPKFALILS